MSSFEKAEYNDYFSGKPQMIIAKGEALEATNDLDLWAEYGKPVMWLPIASYYDHTRETFNELQGSLLVEWQFHVYHDLAYGSWMVIIDNEYEPALVYQASSSCECFEYGNYCITFQEDSDCTNFYKKLA